jgi:predicted ferric reductase
MIKILRHFKKKAIIFCIIAIILVMAAAYFDATQPTFLQDALSGLSKIYRINQKDGD